MLFARVKPMLCVKGETPFDNDKYLFEPKIDGVRVLFHADYEAGKIKLFTRHGNCITAQFPEFQSAVLPSVNNIILDGELTILSGGRPDFNLVMTRLSSGPDRATQFQHSLPATIVVFDILHLNHRRLTELPLIDRKSILLDKVPDTDLITKNLVLENDGTLLFEQIRKNQLEGMLAKPKVSKYYLGQRKLWVKIKNYYYREIDVLGYVYKKGALLVGKNGIPVAQALGLRPDDRKAIRGLLPEISEQRKGNTVFIKPGLRCRIKFTVGASGAMRECVFDRWTI